MNQEPKKPEASRALLKTLHYYRSIYPHLLFCTFIGLSRMAIMLIEPQIISLMVDRVIKPALGGKPVDNSSIFLFLIRDIPKDNLWEIMGVLSAAFIFFMIIYFLTFYARWNIIHHASIKIENKMRTEILTKVNNIGPSILKTYTNGELISLANSDATKAKDIFIAIIPFMLDCAFYIVMAGYFLVRASSLLLICPILILIAYFIVTRGLIKSYGEFYDNMWMRNSELNTEAQESIYGIRTIKAYARENYRANRFREKSSALKDFYIKFSNKQYKYFLFYDSLDQILIFISMGISIYLASKFMMTDGEYTAFIGYLLTMVGCIVDIIFMLGDVQSSKVSAKRVFGFLELKSENDHKYGELKVSSTPNIKFENVTVISDDKELVKDLNVDIPYGKKIGVMGKTGSGKSVFLRTMQGFTDYSNGKILIDDKDFYEYDKVEIARAYSYAMQDVFLFSNSIASNIEFYEPRDDMDKVKECGKLSEVDEFVSDFTDGYNTVVGEKGFGLSGGQKQRVAIARALYKDAPVIVLDDCTSALDVETESKIFANLKRVFGNKTLLMATHRAQELKDCDEILFFEDGKIAERGTFSELMALDGLYASIYKKQLGSEV